MPLPHHGRGSAASLPTNGSRAGSLQGLDLLVTVTEDSSIIDIGQTHRQGPGKLEAFLAVGVRSANILTANTILDVDAVAGPDGIARNRSAGFATRREINQSIAGIVEAR